MSGRAADRSVSRETQIAYVRPFDGRIAVRMNEGPRANPFNLAIDSKLRAGHLTRLWVSNIYVVSQVVARATVMQQKMQRPVQFEITEQTRFSSDAWIRAAGLSSGDYVFPSRIHGSPHLLTGQYARLVHQWGSISRHRGRRCFSNGGTN